MKGKLKSFALVLAVFLFYSQFIDADEHLRYAAIIYRHGDRTPVDPYPTDPWRNQSLWPVQFGELTNVGKLQHFHFGKWLRRRYNKTLISSAFDPTEIYIRSTDVDRTLMSAQANLAGMFPPLGKSIWNMFLDWQPIPIHTVPEKEDAVLAMKKNCPAYDAEHKKMTRSVKYRNRLAKYSKLMDYLSFHTGMKVNDYADINDIYSVLKIEQLYNFTLPEWTKSVFPDKMVGPAGYSFAVETNTPLLARLKIGPFMKEVVGNMVKVMHTDNSKIPYHMVHYADVNGTSPLKFHMYSAHDLTVASVLNGLGMFDGKCPEYTATVFFELVYDDSVQIHFVKIFYRNTPDIVEPDALMIPTCGYRCPLERFIKMYDNLLPENWESDCALKVKFPVGLTLTIVACAVLFGNYVYRKTRSIRKKKAFSRIYSRAFDASGSWAYSSSTV